MEEVKVKVLWIEEDIIEFLKEKLAAGDYNVVNIGLDTYKEVLH